MKLRSYALPIKIVAFLGIVFVSACAGSGSTTSADPSHGSDQPTNSVQETTGSTAVPRFKPMSSSFPFTHIKVAQIDYMTNNWNGPTAQDPTILPFMASHYNLIIGGGKDLSAYTSNPPPQFVYTNYYCMYVGNAEYQDAQAWATAHGVDFETFFIHYAEPTTGCFGSVCYQMVAGSRVPTYAWYGTGGDMTVTGARVVMNPGNPNYRLWKLDYLDRLFRGNSNYMGTMVDNTILTEVGTKLPTATVGGGIAEYEGTTAGGAYGNDLLTLFKEFRLKFGASKWQLPNVANYSDSQSRINLAYDGVDSASPYIWGVVREMVLTPHRVVMLSSLAQDIQNSERRGVENVIGGGVFVGERYQIPYLAQFYMIKTASTYFSPFLQYVADQWGIDPRINQWIPAITYNIGQPKNDPAEAVKFKSYYTGIDPSSGPTETMTVASVTPSGGSYRLSDPTKNWASEQWKGKRIVFPSGYSLGIYHSGTDWVDVWAPAEIPTPGNYDVGNRTYVVHGREFDNALVLFKPLPTYDTTETGTPSLTTHTLPSTPDNPTGQYYSLNSDGTLNGVPITSVQLRNADGAILIKKSAAVF